MTESQFGEPADTGLMHRADLAANAAVESEGPALSSALGTGNVVEAEQVFYRVFRKVYLQGFEDGKNDR